MTSEIIDPTRRTSAATGAGTDAPRPQGLDGLRVGLLENGKRNAASILAAVGRELTDRHGAGDLVPLTKHEFAMPLSEELLAQLQRECDVVVIGVGDCGSCSASAVADGVKLEQTGLPTAVVCTETFAATSQAMAELQGDPQHPFIITEHPIANLTEEQIAERGRALVDQVAQRLLTGRPAGEVA